MTEINLTAGEVAQAHLRLYRIQQRTRNTFVYNQARQLLLLIKKAERRELAARRKSEKILPKTF